MNDSGASSGKKAKEKMNKQRNPVFKYKNFLKNSDLGKISKFSDTIFYPQILYVYICIFPRLKSIAVYSTCIRNAIATFLSSRSITYAKKKNKTSLFSKDAKRLHRKCSHQMKQNFNSTACIHVFFPFKK